MLGAFAARSSQIDYGERKIIDELLLNYQSSSVINSYVQGTFFHRTLNYILRQQKLHEIYLFRHAITDLINCLRQPLPAEEDSVSLVLYRGQQMTIFEIEKMKNNVGEIFSAASFLSTTMRLRIAQIFAGDGSDNNPYLVPVILEIYLDTGQPMRPYARINNSAEEEVLLSPGMKFILMSCRKLHDNNRIWLLELKAITEKQQEQLALNYGETFLLLSEARGWPTSVVIVHT
ncbi:unnamed protein product [Rotaria sordida]|uniref:NAD(+)--protein-arginine ADP-ribosyltransferase n=1 Tax=Rotaria sordida TaxID=392033 RepID=A0A819LU83_9BILA|nr:unnamed protein product [Rotaria sordida]CAF3966710.1 unnamed protein product [Rotaria sordida]